MTNGPVAAPPSWELKLLAEEQNMARFEEEEEQEDGADNRF